MKIEITAKDYRVSDELEKVIGKKIAKLDKYFDDDAKARVYLKKEKRTCKMEIAMEHKGAAIRAEGNGDIFTILSTLSFLSSNARYINIVPNSNRS